MVTWLPFFILEAETNQGATHCLASTNLANTADSDVHLMVMLEIQIKKLGVATKSFRMTVTEETMQTQQTLVYFELLKAHHKKRP